MPPIYTPIILADNAVITFSQSHELIITDENGVVTAGMSGHGTIRFWAGGTKASNAKIKIYEDGSIEGMGYEFKPDGSGYLANSNISWNPLGDVAVTGKFVSNNDAGAKITIDPITRSLKFTHPTNGYINMEMGETGYPSLELSSPTESSYISAKFFQKSGPSGLTYNSQTALFETVISNYDADGIHVAAPSFGGKGASLFAAKISNPTTSTGDEGMLFLQLRGLPRTKKESARVYVDSDGFLKLG